MTTMVTKKTMDGDNLTVLVVKDANESETSPESSDKVNLPPVNQKKIRVNFNEKLVGDEGEKKIAIGGYGFAGERAAVSVAETRRRALGE